MDAFALVEHAPTLCRHLASLLQHFHETMRELAQQALEFALEALLKPAQMAADGDLDSAVSALRPEQVEAARAVHDSALELLEMEVRVQRKD